MVAPWPARWFDLFDTNRDGRAVRRRPGRRRGAELRARLDVGGYLSDDERDEDADGLTNYDETHGRMHRRATGRAATPKEKPFGISYAGTSRDQDGVRDAATDADSDGDGMRDGADDEDHDDIPNVMELSRNAASRLDDTDGRDCSPRKDPGAGRRPAARGRVRPGEPVQPVPAGRPVAHLPAATTTRTTGAPFDGSPDWYSLN